MMGRGRLDHKNQEVVRRALLCRMFHCTPDKLDTLDYEDILLFEVVYKEMIRKNPMTMFM